MRTTFETVSSLFISGRPHLLRVTVLAAALFSAGPTSAADAGQSDNPLLAESDLPYHFPPFDRIRNEHFEPAYQAGMAEHLKEVEAIARLSDAPTFDNTLVALERSGQLLGRVRRIFGNLSGTVTNPEMERIDKVMAPKLAAHDDAIRLNGALFARIETLYQQRDTLKLDPESRYLLERVYKDFVRAGARLSEEQKARLRGINAELATLQKTFSQNVLEETNASAVLVETRDELDGLPENDIAIAANAAKAAGHEGYYLLRLLNTTTQPALTTLKNRALRQRIFEASITRNSRGGKFDNREVLTRIARLRADRSALLGYPQYADFHLDDQTAGTVGAVDGLMKRMVAPAVASARKEAADLQAVIDAEQGSFHLAPWDWAFYAEKVRRARYAYDASEVRPYFEANRVLIDGVFYAATRLYGVTFKERLDLPKYHEDTRIFEVFNEDGSSLALFIVDWYQRPSKRGGAWANAYVPQSHLTGYKPVIANHLNIPKPPAGEPTLLTDTEVTTAFHEFGHALHGMFSNVTYPRFSGTSVPRDFVEFPSQVNEMWAHWPEVLQHYAKHYQTGAPLPEALLQKITAAAKFNEGFKTTEYLGATLIDLNWHELKAEDVPSADAVLEFESAILRKYGLNFEAVPPRYRSAYFSHVFSGGYAAGYYSYIWSEVLDADNVEWFKQNGGLRRELGDRYRARLLSRGGSIEPMAMYRDVTGHSPDVKYVLERRGLAGPPDPSALP